MACLSTVKGFYYATKIIQRSLCFVIHLHTRNITETFQRPKGSATMVTCLTPDNPIKTKW